MDRGILEITKELRPTAREIKPYRTWTQAGSAESKVPSNTGLPLKTGKSQVNNLTSKGITLKQSNLKELERSKKPKSQQKIENNEAQGGNKAESKETIGEKSNETKSWL